MKHHRRRKQKRIKDKNCDGRVMELSSASQKDEVVSRGAKEDEVSLRENAQLTLFCADPYSFYERSSIRLERKKDNKDSDTALKKRERERKHDIVGKGPYKSSLPPLREKKHNGKQLTFVKRRVIKHPILDNKLTDIKIVATSEFRKKLALSLSFAGIYDLDEMSQERKMTKTKKNQKRKKISKSSNGGVTESASKDILASSTSEGPSFGVTEEDRDEKTASEIPKWYMIKTLSLEEELPSLQDKLILPEIKKNSVPTQSTKHSSHQCNAMTKQRKENRLPRIGKNENRNRTFANRSPKRTDTRVHRRKTRVHDNSFERVYTERSIPLLPVLVNGRSTLS